jgi:hypothetical protein
MMMIRLVVEQHQQLLQVLVAAAIGAASAAAETQGRAMQLLPAVAAAGRWWTDHAVYGADTLACVTGYQLPAAAAAVVPAVMLLYPTAAAAAVAGHGGLAEALAAL